MVDPQLRVLIVDDEPLARRRLARILASQPELACVGECDTGAGAIEWLSSHHADVVLLDVHMPGLSGLDVARAVEPSRMPAVVFVTAFDHHAVAAFAANAVDYVLKPFTRERLLDAIERARRRVTLESAADLAARLERALRDAGAPTSVDRLLVKRTGAMQVVSVPEIEWIEAQGNYAALHIGKSVHLVRETLTRLEQRLDARQFVRIRRTAIVNVQHIVKLDPWEKDEHVVVMTSGVRVAVTRGFSERLEKVLDTWRI